MVFKSARDNWHLIFLSDRVTANFGRLNTFWLKCDFHFFWPITMRVEIFIMHEGGTPNKRYNGETFQKKSWPF